MNLIKTYYDAHPPAQEEMDEIASFLYEHLEAFGDPVADIRKAMDYAMKHTPSPGGMILTSRKDGALNGAVVVNKTGMDGYIPENILVYIATHKASRGQGIGRELMQQAIQDASGDIALHVEPENPAKRLYERLGFTNKYLEMRLKK